MRFLAHILGLLAFLVANAAAQTWTYPECTQPVAVSDDCADVINANACYNKFRWNANTLTCIGGKDNADKQRKACLCCSCVATAMCNWVTNQKFQCATLAKTSKARSVSRITDRVKRELEGEQ